MISTLRKHRWLLVIPLAVALLLMPLAVHARPLAQADPIAYAADSEPPADDPTSEGTGAEPSVKDHEAWLFDDDDHPNFVDDSADSEPEEPKDGDQEDYVPYWERPEWERAEWFWVHEDDFDFDEVNVPMCPDPGPVTTYEEWLAEQPVHGPFSIRETGRRRSAVRSVQATPEFRVIVESGLYPGIATSIATYLVDLANEGYNASVHQVTGGTEEELRDFIFSIAFSV